MALMLINSTTKKLIAAEMTPFGNIEIWQEGTTRSLFLKDQYAIQSQLDLIKKEQLLQQYTRAMMSFLLFINKPDSVLLFGLGGGSIIHFLSHWFPNLKITAIDNNLNLINISKKYFAISESSQISIKVCDAYNYITQMSKSNHNVILLDIHDGHNLPLFISNCYFLKQCHNNLADDGILVINILTENNQYFLKILIALRQSFSDISFCIPLKEHQNVLLFAFKSLKYLDVEQLKNKAYQCKKKYGIEFEYFIDNMIKIDKKLNAE